MQDLKLPQDQREHLIFRLSKTIIDHNFINGIIQENNDKC